MKLIQWSKLGLLVGSQAKQEQEVRSITINFLHTFTHEWKVRVCGGAKPIEL